jgi:TRAP-type C4-dicarboxylate transport system substrate-binding protein
MAVFYGMHLSAMPAVAAPVSITWRAQSLENEGTSRFECVKYMCDLIKEKSNGQLTIELYTADALFPTMNAVETVKNGVVEAAFTST